jgi:hypothetical protein
MKPVLGRAVVGAAALTLALSMSAIAGAADAAPASGAAPAPEKAATAVTLGQTSGPGVANCGAGTTIVQYAAAPPAYSSPTAGVLTSFSYYANNAGSVRAVVLGPSATPTHRTVSATSSLDAVTPGSVNTFPVRIAFPAGSTIGLYVSQNDMGCLASGPVTDIAATSPFDPATATDYPGTSPVPGTRADISAVLEPDADGDGYGDVSQDACPQSATTQTACPAPDTTVTKAPKKKSTKTKVKIKFTSVAGAKFTCQVDKKAAQPCTSPFKKKFKPGKHKVLITATSPAGIVEVAPATVKFKIVKPS